MKFEEILLISDMDGTLLNPDHKIFDENISAINRFISQGGCFTLATGREWHALDEYAQQLPLSLPLILVNGAQIYNPLSNEIISKRLLSRASTELLLQIADEFSHLGIIAVSDGGAVILREPKDMSTMPPFYNGYPVKDLKALPMEIYKVLFVGTQSELAMPRELIDRKYSRSLTATCSYPTLLDVMSSGISKGVALKDICKLLPSECRQGRKIIVVGDQENDIEMFNESDYAFAMGQASDHVKAAADEVLPPSDEPFMEVLLRRVQDL